VIPGVGTVVAELPESRAVDRSRLLKQEVDQLVVEAKRLGLKLPEILRALESQWAKLERPLEVNRK
jgi:DNA-binding transcriptional regulator YhcF (GntR family)